MRRFGRWHALLSVVLLSAAIDVTTQGALAQSITKCEGGGLMGSIVVDASHVDVFEAIKKSRYLEPERRKVVSRKGNRVVLEEAFARLPIIGAATCTYAEVEIPHKRIEYQIIESKQFKKFNGAWEVSPIDDGKTLLRLTSQVDTFITVPFKKQLMNAGTKKDIKRRLRNIKKAVEAPDKQTISFRIQRLR